MGASPHTKRILTLLIIAIVTMILAMSVLMGVVFLSSASLGAGTERLLTETAGVDETVSALVSTMLVSTPSPSATKRGQVVTNGTDEAQQGSAGPSEAEDLPSLTPTSPASPTMPLELTPTPNPWVQEKLASMTLNQKVGQMILTGINGTNLTTETCQFIQRVVPGGIIYLSSNIASPYPSQLASLSTALQTCMANISGVPLLISIDHEGAYVNRFPAESQMTIFPPAMAFGAAGEPDLAYQAASAAGWELRANGINMILGPVADVLTNYDNTVISQRAYGGDPSAVGEIVSHAVQGYLAAGVLPVLKHYPGHGDVSGDSHNSLPVDPSDLSHLLDVHLLPFKEAIDSGAQVVMVSHVAFPVVDPQGLPASLSPSLYKILGDELAFQGFSMSDSMGMGAISSTGLGVEAASVKAINAGLDMLMLVSPDLAESVHSGIISAVQRGEIPASRIDQAVSRILKVKSNHGLDAFPSEVDLNPDWDQNAALAYQVGYQSVSLYKDQADLIPLPPEIQDILVVGPADGWGLYPLLRTALDRRGIRYNIMTFSNYWFATIPETSYLQIVPARAPDYDLVLVFTWDSHPNRFRFGDTFQGELVESLLAGGHKLVVIALKSPTDLLDFPNVQTYLSSLGTTRGQLHGLIDILVGETQPAGQIPLPNLP